MLRHLHFMVVLVLLGGLAILVAPAGVHGSTVGLWLMDDLVDQTPPVGDPPADPPGGETLFDSSGNNLHFVANADFGTIGLDPDRPGPLASVPNTFSLDSKVGGARGLSTPSTALLHRKTTGALTAEFWFKQTRRTPSISGILAFPGGNGNSAYAGDWGFYSRADGDVKFYYYGTSFPEITTGVLNENEWYHIAGTVDAAGAMVLYLNGNPVGSASVNDPSTATADVLKLGRIDADTFGDQDFMMDELRVSDVALLPGNGTGIGELAWNASLVPEPATLGLLALALVGMARRK